ncbi:MAG TPA: MFS transporter [Caulifigura sp.]|nr:MFS transporter [Caulifigura sp.]
MTERPTLIRYAALSWLALAAGLAYLCRNAVGVVESTIRTDLGLSLDESGWCMSAFFWSYAVLQIPAGSLSAKWGTRLTMAAFAVAWSLASIAIGLAPGFWMIVIAQLVMGASQAGIFPASINSIGHWMPMSERSFSCGVLAAGMQLGAIAASCLTGALVADVGWRWVFAIFALPGFVWTIAFLLRFHDRPEQDPKVSAEELAIITGDRPIPAKVVEGNAPPDGFWMLALQPAVLWLCGQQICRAAGYMFFASWFPTFLQKTRGISVEHSGYMQALVLGGSLAGSLCGGMLTDWVWRKTGSLRLSRSLVGGGFLMTCAVLILSAWFVESANLAVTLLAAGALVAGLAGPSALAATIDLGGRQVPQVFGLMNMTGNIAAALCPILVGRLFALTGNWNLVLLLFAGIYLLGAMCWAFIKPGAVREV